MVFADKVITREDLREMEEWIMMTKFDQLFEEKRIQYGKEQAKKATEKATRKTSRDIAKNMLVKGFVPEDIREVVKTLSIEEIRRLEDEVKIP